MTRFKVIQEPINPRQALVRRLSVINLENFRRQYARRRWKLSFRIVTLCNHLTRMMKKGHPKPQDESGRTAAPEHPNTRWRSLFTHSLMRLTTHSPQAGWALGHLIKLEES
ncbi:hypothetical protein AAFF_G00285000 [Aldrovandia affinis]|uniref:Uncharacterized protein n=1 Tax=Aldrovandia affinis TaxID=143900 RepID=A0AAD7TBI1_9TELE|nr:hypothetical protein AAFF_G00285000 [Aldrovandia affinis]